jgi:hypothetical protein
LTTAGASRTRVAGDRDRRLGLENPPNSMEMKEFHSMHRHHRGLFLGLALSALIGLSATQAQAETIVMTVQVGGGPVVDLTTFGGVGTANGYTMDATAIANLNAFLTTSGSEYQFSSTGATTLGGISNFPGGTLGALALTGSIISNGPGNSVLTLVESEGGFTSPTGALGILASSSTGNFLNQAAGSGHTASSAFNGTSTPTYSVLSVGGTVGGVTTRVSTPVAPVTTLYTLTNTITFGLTPGNAANPVADGFNVVSAIGAAAVPEPASLVMMLTGIPVPMVMLGWLRRRRRAAA